MSANKRRKLDVSPNKPQLSAFAARQALQSKSSGPKSKQNGQAALGEATPVSVVGSSIAVVASDLLSQNNLQSEETSHSTKSHNVGREPYEDEELASDFESRAESPEIALEPPSIPLSSFKPSKANVKDAGKGTVQITLAPGERLVIVGQYELCIRLGQITMMGCVLEPSETFHRVFAASSHSLPVIRCLSTDIKSAEILLRVCKSGLDSLNKLSPLFGRLWNDQSGPLGSEYPYLLRGSRKTTFQILFSTKFDSQPSYVHPMISPPEWNQLLSKFSDSTEERKRTIMVCGPKSSGKSTFAKILGNRLLSQASKGVALLDLDPGQPEYSPPGQLALVHIQEPNFGAPFSHPVPGGSSKIIRAHSIGSISPALDPHLYMSCVLDLFSHYRQSGSAVRDCPLIINTPGWVFGTGLEILVDIIGKIKPTDIIYMSQEGPPQVYGTLKEAAGSTPLHTLPSQLSEYTTRTAAHLRTMQAMSYFHLDPASTKSLSWTCQPLTSYPPWEIRYTGENPGIRGVMCYGEQPPADLLAETINGSLVAVVVIDDMAAIPGWDDNQAEHIDSDANQSISHEPPVEDTKLQVFDPFQPHHTEQPSLVQTPVEHIPYFNPANAITLDPQYSHSIGLALVRGIDVARQRIQLLTPISPSVIEAINGVGKSIVLVSGKLDTPGWAYIEDLNLKTAEEKATRKGDTAAMDVVDERDDEQEDEEDDEPDTGKRIDQGFGKEETPWVEELKGSQGRGLGSRVWRVRRDLGRIGDGGE